MIRIAAFILIVSSAVAQPLIEARFSPNGGCEREVAQQIDRAKVTLDVAIYAINEVGIVKSIIAAHRRGVRVRVMADKTEAGIKTSGTNDLARAGVPMHIQRGSGGGILHLKLVVVDGKVALAGSFNHTGRAAAKNDEILVTIRDLPTVRLCAAECEKLWRLHATP